jgi:hypothetical protein
LNARLVLGDTAEQSRVRSDPAEGSADMTSVKHRQSNKRRGRSAVGAGMPAENVGGVVVGGPNPPVMGRFEPMSCRIDWSGLKRAVQLFIQSPVRRWVEVIWEI